MYTLWNIGTYDFESISKVLKHSNGDVALNATFDGDIGSKNLFLRFDILSRAGGEFSYSSRHYNMSEINGLFDLFDDFCNDRIRFFSSGKNIQSFLVSLYESEEQFFKKYGFDFLDYYGVINNEVVDEINLSSPSKEEVMGSKVCDGYGISNESNRSYSIKREILNKEGCLSESIKILFDSFNKNKMLDNGYCSICVNTTDDPPKIMMDDTIGLPIIFHSRKFMRIFLYNLSEPFTFGGFMPLNNSNVVSADLWKLGSSTTIGDVVSICGDDGKLEFSYSRDDFKDRFGFLDGECESINLDVDSFDEETLVASII